MSQRIHEHVHKNHSFFAVSIFSPPFIFRTLYLNYSNRIIPSINSLKCTYHKYQTHKINKEIQPLYRGRIVVFFFHFSQMNKMQIFRLFCYSYAVCLPPPYFIQLVPAPLFYCIRNVTSSNAMDAH